MLYVIPTPIGNLKDITLRSLEVLRQVDYILVEDSRVTTKLLKHYDIVKPMVPYHNFNEHKQIDRVVKDLLIGKAIALVSDAGMPGISDPGYLIVRNCIDFNLDFEVLPGASAVLPALVLSGLPSHRFHFEGFLPHKKGRKSRIAHLSLYPDTILLYESPHRIHRTIKELGEAFGEREAVLVREISKLHEECLRGTLTEIESQIEGKKIKGELVLVVAGSNH